MRYRRLGRTALQVSELCLGTMTFGNQCDERASFAILDRAADDIGMLKLILPEIGHVVRELTR